MQILESRRDKNVKKAKVVAVFPVWTRKPGKVLVVTSRRSKSWSLAKGHVDPSLGAIESARREAFEEAGVRGRVMRKSIGSYIHRNSVGGRFQVKVFLMHVREELSNWPEKRERQRQWITVDSDLDLISNRSLRRLIKAHF